LIAALRPIWPTAAILLAGVLAAGYAPPLKDSLIGLRELGPYVMLVAAAAVSVWFNRERAFVLSVSLLAAFAAGDRQPGELSWLALATLVPVNALLALALPERGARFGRAWRWIALIGLEAALVYFAEANLDLEGLDEHLLLRDEPAPPLLARLAFAGAFAAAVWRAWPHYTPLEIGFAGALTSFYIACGWIDNLGFFALFNAAAAAILLVAVLQESHRMAFRDALTALPNRRALEDQLRALMPPYAVAMIDIDHFKKFNDVHGHAIGDQVLRLVAARLGEIGGGGRAFRYGGEEFTVLFRGQRLVDVMAHLEATRAAVEAYKMTMRGEDRPKDKKEGSKRRSAANPDKPDFSKTDLLLSVTVSIGAAEPGKRMRSPAEVVKGADEALYRAKERGRNKVSR
jgi:diguanylate cyclase (GGDEF)-like protein